VAENKDKKSSEFSYKVVGVNNAPAKENPRGNGIKMRGTGAAKKGTRCRGPMG
jgi:hypothetical protein